MSQYILYTKEHCPMCDLLEEKLIANKTEFIKETDEEEMAKRNITHTPMMDINGELYDIGSVLRMITERVI